MKSGSCLSVAFASVAVGLFLVASAQGTLITVNNGSFELLSSLPKASTVWDYAGDSWTRTDATPEMGSLLVGPGTLIPSLFGSTLPDGSWAATLQGASVTIDHPLEQNLSKNVTAGDTLSVTFYLGNSTDNNGTEGFAYFDVGGQQYTQYFDTRGITPGTFVFTTMSTTIINSGNLKIGFYNASGYSGSTMSWVDKVSGITQTSGDAQVPEPGTWLLLGGSLLGLCVGGFKRFVRK